MKKPAVAFYVLVSVVVMGLMLWVLHNGQQLSLPGKLLVTPVSDASQAPVAWWQQPLPMLMLQAVLVILAARMMGILMTRIHQPVVVGEIIAGLLLGPSFLGALMPGLSAELFPPSSFEHLYFISQLGLLFFLFIVGMELDIRILKTQARSAVWVSNIGVVIPFITGMGIAYFLYTDYAVSGATFSSFALFIGISLSITAFPVLMRMVQEFGLGKTSLGFLAITCAAADDVIVWCLLAAVVAMVKAGSFVNALGSIALAVAYVTVMFLVVRPILQKLGAVYGSREIFNKRMVGLVLLILLTSSLIAEWIGIHALFGAFLAGVVMPNNLSFKKIMTEKMEDMAQVFLLPLFFLVIGLRTDVGVMATPQMWGVLGLVVLASFISKFGSAALAAKLSGESWKDSLILGSLLNTRGVMAIVVLSIGYDLGILSPEIFAVLVLMALFNTVITGPSVHLLRRLFERQETGAELTPDRKQAFRIFLSFGPSKMGSTLLRLADQLTLKHNKRIDITALHITPSADVKPYEAILYEKEGFQPIRATAQLLGLKLNTVYKNTEDVDKEILATVQQGRFDLVLVGAARPVFSDRPTGGVLKNLLEDLPVNVGVLIDRGFVMAESILLLLGSEDDRPLLQYAYRFRSSNKARITILKVGDGQTVDLRDKESPYYPYSAAFNEVIELRIPDKQLLAHYNLMLIGLGLWNEMNSARATWIKDCPSILVVKHVHDLPADVEAKDTEGKKSRLTAPG